MKLSFTTIILILGMGMLSFSCKNGIENMQGLHNFIEDESNGLKFSKKVDDVELQIKYLPTEFVVAKELEKASSRDANIDSIWSNYENTLFFNLSIKPEEKAKYETIFALANKEGELLRHFSFEMADHFYAIANDADTIRPEGYIYSRMYHYAESKDFTFTFSKQKLQGKDFTLVFKDDFLGIRKCKHEVKWSNLEDVLNLNIKSKLGEKENDFHAKETEHEKI